MLTAIEASAAPRSSMALAYTENGRPSPAYFDGIGIWQKPCSNSSLRGPLIDSSPVSNFGDLGATRFSRKDERFAKTSEYCSWLDGWKISMRRLCSGL